MTHCSSISLYKQQRRAQMTQRDLYPALNHLLLPHHAATLWCSTIHCATLRYIVLHCAALWWNPIHCAALCYIVLHGAPLCSTCASSIYNHSIDFKPSGPVLIILFVAIQYEWDLIFIVSGPEWWQRDERTGVTMVATWKRNSRKLEEVTLVKLNKVMFVRRKEDQRKSEEWEKRQKWGLYAMVALIKGLSCRERDDRWVFRGLSELSGLLQGGDLGLDLELSGSARSSFWPSPGEPRPTAQVRSSTVPAISVLPSSNLSFHQHHQYQHQYIAIKCIARNFKKDGFPLDYHFHQNSQINTNHHKLVGFFQGILLTMWLKILNID